MVCMTFLERKAQRTTHYKKYVEGWKLQDCIACNGSGYYDHDGSPECESCNGTGKQKYDSRLKETHHG